MVNFLFRNWTAIKISKLIQSNQLQDKKKRPWCVFLHVNLWATASMQYVYLVLENWGGRKILEHIFMDDTSAVKRNVMYIKYKTDSKTNEIEIIVWS